MLIFILLLSFTFSLTSAWMSECGRTQYNDSGREPDSPFIAGGWEARPGEFPYMVNFRNRGVHMCGGVLINTNWVLTVAHCTEGTDVNELSVVLGDQRRSEPNPNKQVIGIAEVIDHEAYPNPAWSDDISLLRLATPAILTNFVQPICKPDDSIDYTAFPGTASGWGRISRSGPYPDELRYTNMAIQTDLSCVLNFGDDIWPGMMCIGNWGPNERDPCSGDSGGPVAVKRNDRFEVVGLVSWGYNGCQANWAGVYTRVSYYENWIESKINP